MKLYFILNDWAADSITKWGRKYEDYKSVNCICYQLEGYVVLKRSKSFITAGAVNESDGGQKCLFNETGSGIWFNWKLTLKKNVYILVLSQVCSLNHMSTITNKKKRTDVQQSWLHVN